MAEEYTGEDRRRYNRIEIMLADIQKSIANVHRAFPDEDLDGHRKYHEARIAAAVAEERFWTDLKLDMAKKGLWGLIVIITGLALIGLSVKLGIGGVR